MEDLFAGKRIGVLMGGVSAEREVSLRSGAGVLAALRQLGFDAIPVDPVNKLYQALQNEHIDVAFNALHGGAGEDGTLQGFLETLEIPYTGSGVLASALTLNKIFAKQILIVAGLPTPEHLVIKTDDNLDSSCKEVETRLSLPAVTKPPAEGSSIDVCFAHSSSELRSCIAHLLEKYGCALVEKLISGPEVTVGILGAGESLRALPVLQLVPKKEFYDYEAKYTKGMTDFLLPAPLEPDVYETVQQVALKAHLTLGCHGISRVDMRLDEENIPFITDVNTMPGLTELSDVPAEAKAAGISYEQLILEILLSAAPRLKKSQ